MLNKIAEIMRGFTGNTWSRIAMLAAAAVAAATGHWWVATFLVAFAIIT
jgi:hypothetical protein